MTVVHVNVDVSDLKTQQLANHILDNIALIAMLGGSVLGRISSYH